MDNILASGISNAPHLSAFDEMVAQRFTDLEVQAVLIYLIDTVSLDALPILAEQFDVLGVKGYGLANTEKEKREVIKRAIELHRYKGTPWAVKEALKTIGYYDAEIIERVGTEVIFYDGTFRHNSSRFHGSDQWATFRIVLDLGDNAGIDTVAANKAIALVNEYKNVRSKLLDITYKSTINEYALVSEENELTIIFIE